MNKKGRKKRNSIFIACRVFHKFAEGEWEILKCGRVAGLRFDSNGTLFAADVVYGIFKVNVDTGNVNAIVRRTPIY